MPPVLPDLQAAFLKTLSTHLASFLRRRRWFLARLRYYHWSKRLLSRVLQPLVCPFALDQDAPADSGMAQGRNAGYLAVDHVRQMSFRDPQVRRSLRKRHYLRLLTCREIPGNAGICATRSRLNGAPSEGVGDEGSPGDCHFSGR